MAEIKGFPDPNLKKKQEAEKQEQTKPKVKLKEKSFKQKVKEAIVADDVGDLKEYAILKVLIPAAKKTARSLLINMFDIRFFGKSLGSDKKSNGGGQIVDYAAKSSTLYSEDDVDSLQRLAEKKAHTSGMTLRITELSRVQFETEDEATNALRYLRGNIAEYGVASVSDLLSYAQLKANNTHEKWGWYNLDTAHTEFDPDTDMFYLVLPRPKSI